MHKVRAYADDMILILEQPMKDIELWIIKLEDFGSLAGLKKTKTLTRSCSHSTPFNQVGNSKACEESNVLAIPIPGPSLGLGNVRPDVPRISRESAYFKRLFFVVYLEMDFVSPSSPPAHVPGGRANICLKYICSISGFVPLKPGSLSHKKESPGQITSLTNVFEVARRGREEERD